MLEKEMQGLAENGRLLNRLIPLVWDFKQGLFGGWELRWF